MCLYAGISIHVCMCTKFTPLSLYTYLVSVNKYHCHITNMIHTAIMLDEHIDPTYLHISAKTQPTYISTSHVIAMYGSATNMPLYILHKQILHVHMTQLCQYKYPICNQQCDDKHWCTYVHIIGICP